MNLNIRPSWEEYFKIIVENTALRSPCHRLQVGCLLVNDNRIISQGYNGFLPGLVHESIVENNHEQATVHAEQNAIADCAKRGVSCYNSTAYITHYPCINCFKIMAASGIKSIRYINDYKNDKNVATLSRLSNIIISKI
uniref:CMP/dCMP-type deaminase domain-containing protein n=1 Tax=viral metagenome TaxID=1070528 RepID=A0A6C0C569_9ZZZZ